MKKISYGISRGFILPNGDIARTGTRHDDIALDYLNNHIDLRNEYDKIGGNLCDFMVCHLGALKVGNNIGNPKVITYKDRRDIPKAFWAYIDYYQRQGYNVDKV